MEKFKGTQGYWTINPKSSRNVRCNNLTVANCSSGQSGENEEEEIANAKLVAAAPDLLNALQLMLSRFENVDNDMIKSTYVKEIARNAIFKALS